MCVRISDVQPIVSRSFLKRRPNDSLLKSRKKVKGATTVEFAIGSLVLIFTTLVIFETSYRIYVINLVEYALRETVRNTSYFEGGSVHENYKARLSNLIEADGKMWSYLVSEDNFTLSGKYFNSYDEFVTNVGSSDDDNEFQEGYTIAELTLTYDYSPIINIVESSSTIERTTVLNLEHEGWE